jgi:hypothetical protein
MTLQTGALVWYRHASGIGDAFATRVPGRLVGFTAKRAVVEVEMLGGRRKRIYVSPQNVTARRGHPVEATR